MLERIGIHLSFNFIYILYIRHLISPTIVANSDYILVILCFCLAMFFTLVLEAWHYLLIDLIKHLKLSILSIVLVIIGCLWIRFNLYMILCLGYLGIMMLFDLYRTYQMQKALILYKKRNSSEL